MLALMDGHRDVFIQYSVANAFSQVLISRCGVTVMLLKFYCVSDNCNVLLYDFYFTAFSLSRTFLHYNLATMEYAIIKRLSYWCFYSVL